MENNIPSRKRAILYYFLNIGERFSSLCKAYNNFQYKNIQILHDILLFPFDLIWILISYRDVFGSFPNIIKPKSFSEWVQWNKLFGRKYFFVQCADKISVRNFVEKTIGAKYLPNLLWSGIPSEMDADLIELLPNEFVIKASHGSGMTQIIYDKNDIDFEKLESETRHWINTDFSLKHGEWQYRWIKRKILIEEFLKSSDSKPPDDYKFYCFNGEVAFCNVHLGRFDSHKNLFFNRELDILPISRDKDDKPSVNISRLITKNMYYELIEISEKLSEGFRFVRVDLYYTDRAYFGELTFTPAAGLRRFFPDIVDKILGDIYAGKATNEKLYQKITNTAV